MTEQRINPAIWRTVATELERIAGAEWWEGCNVGARIESATMPMGECVQRYAINYHAFNGLSDQAKEEYRWRLRALAGALRAEANRAEHEAQWHCPIGDVWCEHQQAHE